MTRKEYVLEVTEALKNNPKIVLRGHGMNMKLLNILAERTDVIAKLALFGWKLKSFKKREKSLRKQYGFQIKAYRNFNLFAGNSAEDIDAFVDGLLPEDKAKFQNNENAFVILCLPDSQTTGDLATDI